MSSYRLFLIRIMRERDRDRGRHTHGNTDTERDWRSIGKEQVKEASTDVTIDLIIGLL